MRTVCAGGWGGFVHSEIVLHDDGADGPVSHGMCVDCQRAVEQEEVEMAAIRVRDQSWPRVYELLEEIRDAVVSKRRLTGVAKRPKKKPPGRKKR